MPITKYVLLLDAAAAADEQARNDAADRVIANAGGIADGLAGATVARFLESLTGPPETLTAVQAWVEDSDGTRSEDVLAALTEGIDARVSTWATDEIVFLAPSERLAVTTDHERINLFGTAAKREDFTTEAFFEYWKTTHAPISASVPGSTGYVVSRVGETVATPVERTVDAFIELWWPDHDSFVAAGDSPAQAAAWEDVPNYARTDGQFWLTREAVVVPPPDTGPGMMDGSR